GRAPRLGCRSCGPCDARDPDDAAGGIHEHRRRRAFASADPPFDEKLLELLRPVGEPDAVTGAPAPELERETERRGIERCRRRRRLLVPWHPLDGEATAADDRHAAPALRSCNDERPVPDGGFRPPRARPQPKAGEFPPQAPAAEPIAGTAPRATPTTLKP